jgi:hypothetical protein
MRMKMSFLLFAAALLLGPPLAWAQLGQTAVLTGTVTDTSGAVLPGATVIVTSPALIGGPRSAVTETTGTYRFPALAPGVYTVSIEMPGFRPVLRENVRLALGQTISLDAVLEVGGLEETLTVTGESPVVDVTSSGSQKNLPTELLDYVPYGSRFGPGAMLMAPGVNPNNYVAYGGGGSSANAYMIDGVNLGDPNGGTIWVFANYNWIQEVQIIGLGADAEHGQFTGVASNSLYRSGSNNFSGLFESIYQNQRLTGSNLTDELLTQNPGLTPSRIDYISETTGQLGGPIALDKAWFFASASYNRPKTSPPGFPPAGHAGDGGPTARLERSPRVLFKPTLQITPNDKLTGFINWEEYRVDGRRASSRVAPIATLQQTGPGVSWNGNYTRVMSPQTVFDAKYSGMWGYYYLDPWLGNDTPGWWDAFDGFHTVNSYYYYYADRARHQGNASITHYASGFAGEHNLKFGVELESADVRSELGYPGGMWIFAWQGVPYGAYFYEGYNTHNRNSRVAAYAQDTWRMGRKLTINPGLRFEHFRGYNRHLGETLFTTTAVAPRIGFAYDLLGDSRTVLRGHYGKYFDGAKTSYYDWLDPTIAPVYYADIHPTTLQPLYEPYVIRPGQNRVMDSNIKHPFVHQAILGVERELFPGISVGATGIYRENRDFIDDILMNPLSEFATVQVADPGPDGRSPTGTMLTVYRQLTDVDDNLYLITNPDDGFRKYRGLELTATRRLANRWMMQASWTMSKITGNINNTSSFGNSAEYNDPNLDPRLQPFRTGRLTNDNTHIAKVLGVYHAPLGIVLSNAWYYTSGQTYTRTHRVRTPQGLRDLFVEPRGSQRYDPRIDLDLKAEKTFRVADGRRLGLSLEMLNVTNRNTITSITTRSGATYGTPLSIVGPRRARVTAVYRF